MISDPSAQFHYGYVPSQLPCLSHGSVVVLRLEYHPHVVSSGCSIRFCQCVAADAHSSAGMMGAEGFGSDGGRASPMDRRGSTLRERASNLVG